MRGLEGLFAASCQPWFDTRDDLPRHEGFRPDTRRLSVRS